MTKVLVVDDDPTVVKLLTAKLSKDKRFTVVEAVNGEQAIHLAESEHPDVLLCDIDMPNMDGIAVAKLLAKMDSTKDIPLIFLSSMVTPEDMKRGASAGGGKWPMISKSSTLKELKDLILSMAK